MHCPYRYPFVAGYINRETGTEMHVMMFYSAALFLNLGNTAQQPSIKT